MTSANTTTPAPLTYNTILLLFPPGRPSWHETHTLALTQSAQTILALTTRSTYLSALKFQRSRELDYRQTFIASPSGVPEVYFYNWHAWTRYLSRTDSLCTFAHKHASWLEMLADEYRKIEAVWEEFWDLHEEIEAAKDKADEEAVANCDSGNDGEQDGSSERMQSILTQLTAHNRKKAFLHSKILEENVSEEMRVFFGEGEPEWIEWGNMG